jgi:UDP-glucose 4-epimerase
VRAIVGRDLRVVYDKLRKGDIRSNYGDPSKANKNLRFKAKTSLKKDL